MPRGGVVVLLCSLFVPATAMAQAGCGDGCGQEVASSDLAQFQRWVSGPVGYLLSEKEKKIADALSDPDHLAAFRHWFWERRDPVPETPANEFRAEFDQRVDFVNKAFASPRAGTPGWMTAKGIVYILLGPPTRVTRTSGRVYGDFDDTAVELWVYEFDEDPVLEVPFAAVADGFALLTTPENVGVRARLDEALRREVERFVHNRDLPFNGKSPIVTAHTDQAWHATGVLSRTSGGIAGQVAIPLTDLYGRPEGENLRVELRFEADAPGRRSVLGELSLLLRPDVLERWHDRKLTVALWLPDHDALAAVSEIAVTELASGRDIRLAADARNTEVAQAYVVDELVGRGRLLSGDGAAFAFVGRAEAEAAPSESVSEGIWVLRLPQDFDGIVIEQPVESLLLVRKH